ncbi:MAG: hypothetical protein P1U58_07385 [Verrucomicrobiales bacterium]|nr:hypothetical protein [Verrucomicrobiales bacterium]
MFLRLTYLFFISSLAALPLLAQIDPTAESPAPEAVDLSPDVVDSLEALESVRESLLLVAKDIKEAEAKLRAATEADKPDLVAELNYLSEKQESLKIDFESIATGIDPDDYEGSMNEDFVLANELDTLLEPIIGELKALTEKPRAIEELRSELSRWKGRLVTTENALENLESIPQDRPSEALAEALAETKTIWESRKVQAENRIQAVTYQLEQAERSQPSFIETAREGFRSFYKSRGRNFLLCLIAFFLTFFLLRYIHQRVDRFFPWKKKEKRPFYLRLIDVGLNVFSVLGAVAASLITLYATGDWVLMGLAIILLFGISLAAKNALPKFYDQGRLLLNLGEIREGERVTYNSIPWRVERLSFYSILRNPALRGGELRLPVSQLSGMISRPLSDEGEIWFPSHEGDWVLLPDEGLGRVIAQTPEYVQIVKLGGAKIAIPTADFLGKSPKNLSTGFRISSLFGIDYEHQADCTTTIPETMWAYITKELTTLVGDRDKVVSLKVEFASAGASSLDLAIIADFDGSVAAKYQVYERAIQRFAVECCNEHGWGIPFTQITLHNAFPENESPSPVQAEEKPKLP